MVWPLLLGAGVAGAALGGRWLVRAIKNYKPKPATARKSVTEMTRRFYEGGFEKEMTKREAALILGIRERAAREKILERYRHMMKANHPDRGGSPFLSKKINEAKDMLTKRARAQQRGRRGPS